MNVHQPLLESGLALQDRERAEALVLVRKLRAEARAEIDRLIDFLDASDIDPDLEPALGSPEIPPEYNQWSEKHRMWFEREGDQNRWAQGTSDDCETEDEHSEDDHDGEWSLGSTGSIDQSRWSSGDDGDVEHEHDGREDGGDDEEHEPSGIADADGLIEQFGHAFGNCIPHETLADAETCG